MIPILITAIVSISIWELLRAFIKWMRPEPIEHYIPERHVYPKEEPTIAISQGRTIPNPNYTYNGELPDVYLSNGVDEPKPIKCCSTWTAQAEELVKTEPETIIVEEYMKRGNSRYFRGENVKVVVTVKGGE